MGLDSQNGPRSAAIVSQYHGIDLRKKSGPKSKWYGLIGLGIGRSWLVHFWSWLEREGMGKS